METVNIKIHQYKRLPSNLRPTTRERVHLFTRGHFRSPDSVSVVRSAEAADRSCDVEGHLSDICELYSVFLCAAFVVIKNDADTSVIARHIACLLTYMT